MLNATNKEFSKDPIDYNLIEFACLAHDLGHPPFGHNGEKALDDCMKPFGGFEGNAQTLRILTRVEKKTLYGDPSPEDTCGISKSGSDLRLGLNVTYRSLAAVLKYDNKIPTARKEKSGLVKGYYASEEKLIEAIKKYVGTPTRKDVKFKTIECQIMDIADDIAYSTYDLEDAMKGGFTHLLEIMDHMGDEALLKKLTDKVKKEVSDVTREEVFNAVTDLLPMTDEGEPYSVLRTYRESKLIANDGRMRTRFSSELVGSFIRGASVDIPSSAKELRFSQLTIERDIKIKIESLKHLNYLLTIMSPRLKVVEYRGYDIVKTLFNALSEEDGGHLLLPGDVQAMHLRLKEKSEKMRLICDFIAGMTDRYAVEFYSRLTASGASIYKPI